MTPDLTPDPDLTDWPELRVGEVPGFAQASVDAAIASTPSSHPDSAKLNPAHRPEASESTREAMSDYLCDCPMENHCPVCAPDFVKKRPKPSAEALSEFLDTIPESMWPYLSEADVEREYIHRYGRP